MRAASYKPIAAQTSTGIRPIAPRQSNRVPFDHETIQTSLAQFNGTKPEHRQLCFFYSQTAPSLGAQFDSEFWCVVVPQIARFEPSVQHAMIALASYHENWSEHHTASSYERKLCVSQSFICSIGGYQKVTPNSLVTGTDSGRFAVRQYNKASM
jgi:hypothetical protein